MTELHFAHLFLRDVRVVVPLWEHPLVETHHDRVLLRELVVEDALHVAVGAQRLPDVAATTKLGPANVQKREVKTGGILGPERGERHGRKEERGGEGEGEERPRNRVLLPVLP